MAKQLDATAKDLDQDKKIEEGKKAEGDLEHRIATLEQQVRVLAPLAALLGHVTQIKRHFGFGGGQ